MRVLLDNMTKQVHSLARFLMIGLLATQLGSMIARADIIYNINTTITSSDPTGNPAQSDTIVGSIRTDGTIVGTLAATDILSWNLNLIDNLNAANDLNLYYTDATHNNSGIGAFNGSDLTANATTLFYNYSGADSGIFLIQGTTHGFGSGWSYFCFATYNGECLAGETISPQYITVDGVVATGAAAPIGNVPLGPPSSAPEPSSYALMITILLGVGASLNRRRQMAQHSFHTRGQ